MSSPHNLSNYPHEFYSLRPLSISAQQSTESSLLQFCLKPNFSESFRISNNFPRDTSLSVIQLFSDNQFIQGFLRLINRKPKLRGVLLNRLTGKNFKGQQKIWKKLLSLFLHAKKQMKNAWLRFAQYCIITIFKYPVNCKVCYESPDLNRPCNRYWLLIT